MSARYTVIDGEIIAQERGGVRHQLVPDPLGSTVALYDDSGTKTDAFSYWPYGESASRTGTTIAKFQYVGNKGYYQDNTVLYVRARYLMADKCRWTTEDLLPYKGVHSLYDYCYGNPVIHTDRYGLDPKECCGKDGKPLTCKQLCDSYKNGKNGKKGNVTGGAGYVCCGKSKCPCIWGGDNPGNPPEGQCPLMDACIRSHEQKHIDKGYDTRCNGKSGLIRGSDPNVDRRTRSECLLREETYNCFERVMSRSSSWCQHQMSVGQEVIAKYISEHCKGILK